MIANMDRKLFEVKPTRWKRFLRGLQKFIYAFIGFIFFIILPAALIGGGMGSFMWWYKNTEFVDKLEYKWALEKQYNNGKYNERFCKMWSEPKREMNVVQRDFCKSHDNYKDHPKAVGDM